MSGSHRLGDEVGVLAQAITGAFDLHDHGMEQQTVEQCGCDHVVAEHLSPLGEAAIHGAALVTCVDQLEK